MNRTHASDPARVLGTAARSTATLAFTLLCFGIAGPFRCEPQAGLALLIAFSYVVLGALWSANLTVLASGNGTGATIGAIGSEASKQLAVPIGLGSLAALIGLLAAWDCMTPRDYAAEQINNTGNVRKQIEQRILATGSTSGSGNGLQVPNEGKIVFSRISSDGAMFVLAKEPTIALILKPRLDQGKVEWTCEVYPTSAATTRCRTE